MLHHSRLKLAVAAVALSTVIGCATQSVNPQSSALQQIVGNAEQLSEAEKVRALTDAYFDVRLANSPVYATFVGVNDYNHLFTKPINAQNLADYLAVQQQYLAAIKQINADKLSGQDLLSYQIFKRDRELDINGQQFNPHLLPISQMSGAHNYFAMLGSGKSAQPFNTEQDYRDFISRAQGFALYMDSVIAAMQQGIAQGVVHPEPIAKALLPQLQTHVVKDISNSVFYAPLAGLADNQQIEPSRKAQLEQDYAAMIRTVIIPAYQKVADFVANQYLAQARQTVGLSALPNGLAWYEYQIEVNTTLPLSATEIHQFGLDEVARILSEMQAVKQQVGFAGDLSAFFSHLREDEQFYFDSEQAVIDGYMAVKEDINQRLPALFEVFPQADYVVKAVEPYRADSAAGASYMAPAPDGSRPGVFYINTRDLKAQPKFLLETLSVHEAAPGHHFQIAIQQEVESLPRFRKFGGYTVFSEGWALYAESLGKELGLFSDPYMWYGRLVDEQLRAMRLVVDTGLHAFGWSRQQAIDYMKNNSSMALTDIVAEVERYISIPAQALAYKTGERHISMLREKAASKLGAKFDVRKFHTQILIDGALPMPVLEAKIDRWIAAQLD